HAVARPIGAAAHPAKASASDVSGLTETTHSMVIKLDTRPPSTTATPSGTGGSNGWYVSNVTVSLSATDSGSGVVGISYRVDNGSWQMYACPFNPSEGRHFVQYHATDAAGNLEAVRSATVLIDTTPPASSSALSGTHGNNGWYISDVTATLSATDATSGVAAISYRTDGGAWQLYLGPFTLSDGVHVLEYYATDVAGLNEPAHSATVSIDTQAPTSAIALSGTSGANGWYVSNVTVSLSATDATSGVASISYRI